MEPHFLSLPDQSCEVDMGSHILFSQSLKKFFGGLMAMIAEERSFLPVRRIQFFSKISIIDCQDKSFLQTAVYPLHPIQGLQIHLSLLAFPKRDLHGLEIALNPRVRRFPPLFNQFPILFSDMALFNLSVIEDDPMNRESIDQFIRKEASLRLNLPCFKGF